MSSPVQQRTCGNHRDFSAAAQHTLALLRRRFPAAFGSVKPLKLGIRDDILARTKLTEAELFHFMSFYVNAPAYLSAQSERGAMRHDLDGQEVEPVSEENRIYALMRLGEVLDQQREQQERARYLAFRAALMEPTIIKVEQA